MYYYYYYYWFYMIIDIDLMMMTKTEISPQFSSRAEIVYWPVACATATTDIPWHMPFWNGKCRSETVTAVLKR